MVTLAVQATGIAIIATGMVLVIVSRNIDLSVGSLVGFIAMSYALLMTNWLPALGIADDFPFRWAIALGIGMLIGCGFGAFQGFIIAYIGVPSFIVTLGGLLSIRGARLVPLQRCRGVGPGSHLPAHRRRCPGIGRGHDHVGPRRRRVRRDRAACS